MDSVKAFRPHGRATYAPILLEAGFDLQSLCDITAGDLNRLDIPPSDHGKILAIIDALTWEPGSTQASVSKKVTPPPVLAWTGDQHPAAASCLRDSAMSAIAGSEAQSAVASASRLRGSAQSAAASRLRDSALSAVPTSGKRTTKVTSGGESAFSLGKAWFEDYMEESMALGRPGENQSIVRMASLIIVPFAVSFRAMGYRGASDNDTPKFSMFLPPAFGAMLIVALCTAFLLLKFGVAATRTLLDRKYLPVLGIGLLRGTLVACENVALGYVDALVFAVSMKFAIVPCLGMEALARRKCPADSLQLLTIAISLMGICTSYHPRQMVLKSIFWASSSASLHRLPTPSATC